MKQIRHCLSKSIPALEFLRDELARIIRFRDDGLTKARQQHAHLLGRLDCIKNGLSATEWYDAVPPPASSGAFDFDTMVPEELFWYLPWTIQQSVDGREQLLNVTNAMIRLIPLDCDDPMQMQQFLDLDRQRLDLLSLFTLPFRVLRMGVLYKLGGQDMTSFAPSQSTCDDPITVDHIALLVGVSTKTIRNVKTNKLPPAIASDDTGEFWSYSKLRPKLIENWPKRSPYLFEDYSAAMAWIRGQHQPSSQEN